jgi:hypothetical protein
MAIFIGLLSLGICVSGLLAGRSHHRHVIDRLGDQARLSVIESQLAAMRTALRIRGVEQVTRRRMLSTQRDVFANPTTYEEPDEWRWSS